MPTSRIVLVSLAVLGLVATGCSSPLSGTPVAAGPRPGPAASPSAEPTDPTEPTGETTPAAPVDRPKPIDLKSVDLCQVLAALPLADYRLDADRPPLAGESAVFPGAPDCFANGLKNNVALLVIAVTDRSAQSYVDSVNVTAGSATRAAGYPLTVLTPPAPATCIGVLDVHDGQLLYISYGVGSPTAQPVTPQPRLCAAIPAIATGMIGAIG